MAAFNEILAPRYNRLLQKLLSMKGGAPAPQLSGDISASIALESDRYEWGFLSGEMSFMMFQSQPLDVANFSFNGLFNGQQTGTLGMVDGVLISNPTAAALTVELRMGISTALLNQLRGQVLDLRWGTKASAMVTGRNVEAAQSGTRILLVTLPANASAVYVPLRIVLPPQPTALTPIANICLEGTAINNRVDATWFWRERAMEASEGPAGV